MNAPNVLRVIAGSLLISGGLFFAGCDEEDTPLPEDRLAPDPDLPEAVVDLPPPPPESAFEIREYNEDGSLRVEGVIGNRDRYIDDEVEVRGVVARFEGRDCTPGEDERCLRPHLFIRDEADDDLELTIVGYENEFLDTADISEGDSYLFRGTYTLAAHGFTSSEIGMIDLIAVEDEDDEYEVNPED